MWTRLFYHSSAQMHFCNVEFQVVGAVGGIRTLGAHLIFYSQMNSFDVNIHILLQAESLVTVRARDLGLWLNIGLTTTSPKQVLFQALENTSTYFTGLQHLTCVLPLPVGLHI